jgi:CIC family chloride channel protein
MKPLTALVQILRKLLGQAFERSLAGLSHFDPHERRLVFQAVVVGVVVWCLVYPLKVAVHHGFSGLVTTFETMPSIVLILLPLTLGAVMVYVIANYQPTFVAYEDHDGVHKLNAVEGDGLERAITLYFSSEPRLEEMHEGVAARWKLPTFSLAFRKMGATLATLCSGGSGGLEASVTLIGESIAAGIFKPRRRPHGYQIGFVDRLNNWWQATEHEDLQTAQLCGIAAAVSTLMGTPFGAAFFAIEVMYRRQPIINRLIYALLSSLIAFFLTHVAGSEHTLFAEAPKTIPAVYSAKYYFALFAVCASIAVVGIYFRLARASLDQFFIEKFKNPLSRHVAGAAGVGVVVIATYYVLLFLDMPTEQLASGPGGVIELVLGPGEGVLELAVVGKLTVALAVVALFAKLVATLMTITSGGSAGLLFPTIFFGTTIAVAWAGVFDLDPLVLIAPAMTASLVSIVNVPLAAILMVIELFGAQFVVPALFALVATSILTHHNNIYRTQQESFDVRRVFPGVSIHRLIIPDEWHGQSLVNLDVRKRFGLTVLGLVDRQDTGDDGFKDGVVVNPDPESAMQRGDVIVVLGKDSDLKRFTDELTRQHKKSEPEPPQAEPNAI